MLLFISIYLAGCVLSYGLCTRALAEIDAKYPALEPDNDMPFQIGSSAFSWASVVAMLVAGAWCHIPRFYLPKWSKKSVWAAHEAYKARFE